MKAYLMVNDFLWKNEKNRGAIPKRFLEESRLLY